jgi:hypothetical protein
LGHEGGAVRPSTDKAACSANLNFFDWNPNLCKSSLPSVHFKSKTFLIPGFSIWAPIVWQSPGRLASFSKSRLDQLKLLSAGLIVTALQRFLGTFRGLADSTQSQLWS